MIQGRLKTILTLSFCVFLLAVSCLMLSSRSAQASPADFALSAKTTSQTIPRSQDALYTITVQGGFTGTVNFSFTGHINHGFASFSAASVTGSGSTTFDVHSGEDSPAGTFPLTVIGTSGSVQHAVQVTLTISDNAPNFSVSATPATKTLQRGQAATFDIHVQGLNGFNGTVTFTIDSGPTTSTLSFTNASVAGAGDTIFKVQTSQQSTLGSFTVTLIGISGGLDNRVQTTYVVTA